VTRTVDVLSEVCPTCGAPMTESRYSQLQDKLRREEREKLEAAIADARSQSEAQLRRELEGQAASIATKVDSERSQWALQLKAAESARGTEAQTALEEKAKLKAEFQRLLKEQAERVAVEAKERTAAELAAALAEKARIEEALKLEKSRQAEAEARHQAEMDAAAAEGARLRSEEAGAMRAALEKDRDDKLRVLNKQRTDEQQGWQTKIVELQRSLDKKTSHELGDWPELDLYNSLQEQFRDDRVRRVAKGEEGADVIIEVMHRGESCGKIIVDSKNRKSWQNRYVEKIRQDQDAAKAAHAVLATSVFPSGDKDVCIREGVVIVKPQAVVAIVSILRDSMLREHIQGLGLEKRSQKAARLYDYLTSGEFQQKLVAARRVGDELEQLDVEEHKAHSKIWQRRGTLHRQLGHSLGEIQSHVAAVVEGVEPGQSQIA